MELCIQDFMRNALLGQHLAEKFGSLNGDGTNQNRLSLLMCLYNFFNNCIIFFFLGLINSVI